MTADLYDLRVPVTQGVLRPGDQVLVLTGSVRLRFGSPFRHDVVLRPGQIAEVPAWVGCTASAWPPNARGGARLYAIHRSE